MEAADAFALATDHFRSAVAADEAKDIARALEQYQTAIQYFLIYLPKEPAPDAKVKVQAQVKDMLDRAESLKALKNTQCNNAEAREQSSDMQESPVNWPSSSIKQTAEHLRRAVQADQAGDLPTAIAAYKQGLELLIDRLKTETEPTAKAGITAKARQYIERTEMLAALSAAATAAPVISELGAADMRLSNLPQDNAAEVRA